MLLDPQSFDLVQHIDTFLATVVGHELEAQMKAELMQSVLEIATPVCRTAAEVDSELRKLREYVTSVARQHSLRVGSAGHPPLQPLRAAADHRARPLPRPRRPDAVRRAARAHLRAAHPRRGRRPREGDPGRERPPRRAARRCSRSRRTRRSGAASRRASPRLGRWSSPPSRAQARRRASPATTTTPRSSASSRRPAASPTTRTSGGTSGRTRVWDRGDPDLRRRHSRRARRRARGVLPGARQALLRAVRPRRGDPLLPPDPDEREQVARGALRARGAADGPRDRAAGTACPSPSSSAAGSRSSCRTRGSSARRASSRASRISSRTGTAPPASSASSTRTGPRRGRSRDRRRDRGCRRHAGRRLKRKQKAGPGGPALSAALR